MSYLTVEELKTRNVIEEIRDANPESDIALQFLIDYCSALIDSYVGFSFVKEEDKTIHVSGEDSKKLALQKRIYNLLAVKTINKIYNIKNIRIVGDKQKQLLSLDEYFEEGYLNIEVKGDFGWVSVPKDVIDCLVILCNGNFNSILDAESLERASGVFSEERIGDYHYKIDKRMNPFTGEQMDSTGNMRVDQILDKYKDDDFFIGVI